MSQPPAPAPTCPRHPDRESHVRCQRCSRPTCPDCQRPAAVGIHCVDCVAQARRETPATRTVFGGVAVAGPPVVTYTLIGLCVLAYIGQWTIRTFTYDGMFSPQLGEMQPWRFLTAAFLHDPSTPLHILLNMLCLWQVGGFVESLLGRVRFAALYLISAVSGSVGVLLLATPPTSLSELATSSWLTTVVGASGAVFGLFAAMFMMLRSLGRSAGSMLVLLGLNLLLPFLYPSISWQAHLGGLVGGALTMGAILATREKTRRRWQWPAIASVAVFVVILALVKYAVTDDSFVQMVMPRA